MSDIQTPNGLEANETLVGSTDEIEVYQPASAGVRRNKRALLNTLKTLYQTITGGTLNNIVTLNGSAVVQDSGVAVADIGTNTTAIGLNTTHRGSDGKDHSDVVLNNTHRGSDGKDHSDVVLNNTHRTSDGSDHTFIDQDVKVAADVVHNTINIGNSPIQIHIFSTTVSAAASASVAHGLTGSKIQGFCATVPSGSEGGSGGPITAQNHTSTNLVVLFQTANYTGPVRFVMFYIP